MIATNRLPTIAAVLVAMTLFAVARPLAAQHRTDQEHLHQQEQDEQELERTFRTRSGRETPAQDSVPEDTVQDDPDAIRIYTSDGSGKLRFESADGGFKGRFGGRVMVNYTFGEIDSDVEAVTGPVEDGTELRRARLFTSGTLYDIGYKIQLDFADGTEIKDAYLEFPSPLPNSKIGVGRYKEPFGLETLTSSKYTTFKARSILTEFAPGRTNGVAIFGSAADDHVNYGFGVFRSETDDFGESQGDGEWAVTGRFTFAPWRSDDGARLLHLGAAASRRSIDSSEPSSEGHEPEVHLAPDFVATGDLVGTENETLVGAESALVYGPLSVQAEYSLKEVGRETGSDVTFHTWYSFVSFFLTGEHRPYDGGFGRGGSFSRVSPTTNFTSEGGTGAWEIAARFSHMDLNDQDVIGGEANNVTLGVNWYLNPSVRVMANYVLASVDDAAGTAGVDGEGHFGSVRFQIDF